MQLSIHEEDVATRAPFGVMCFWELVIVLRSVVICQNSFTFALISFGLSFLVLQPGRFSEDPRVGHKSAGRQNNQCFLSWGVSYTCNYWSFKSIFVCIRRKHTSSWELSCIQMFYRDASLASLNWRTHSKNSKFGEMRLSYSECRGNLSSQQMIIPFFFSFDQVF